MAEKFLNLSGLNTLWSKIKTALNGKTNFRYGRIYITTSYKDVARRYVLLAKAEITFNNDWQETSEFILRFYPDNNVKILKFNLRIGGSKTAVYASKFLQHSYLENMTEAQAAAVRVRYTFSEGSCKFWIYLDRSIYAPIFTCVQIQPLSIGSGYRSNKISNGLGQWIFSNGNDSNDALVSAEMEGESELEIESREIHANILSAQTLTQTLPISKGGTGVQSKRLYFLPTDVSTKYTDMNNILVEDENMWLYKNSAAKWTNQPANTAFRFIQWTSSNYYSVQFVVTNQRKIYVRVSSDSNGSKLWGGWERFLNLNDLSNIEDAITNAESALTSQIVSEVTARSEADESLQENINAEARARVSADNALQESINSKANSSELSSKLNTSGSNASITTTNALLDKGDVISDYTKLSDNDYVITKSSNTNRTSLGSLYAWIISKFESLTGRFLNLQVYQGENGALTNVATDYSLNLNYYTKSAVDTLLAKKANGTALNSLGNRVDDIEEQLETAGIRSPGRCLRPTCVFEANASASIDAIRQNYNTAIYPYDICIIINVSSSSITISGFQTSSGTESYSVPAYKCVMFTALGTNSQYIKTTDKT